MQSFAVQLFQPKLPDPIMEPWRWRTYPELEGKGIQCMAEGKDGTLWFGSENGIVFHYDGLNLKQWRLHEFDSLLSSPISNLLFTKEGILYVGTEIGLFTLNSGHWKPAVPLSPNFNWSISGLIESDDGAVYAGTKFGLLAIKQSEVWLYTARDQVEAIQTFANTIKLVVVPDKITTQHAWSRGFGIFTRGKVIYALASSCAARKSGVAVGDSILATDGNKDSLINLFNNEIDTSITLKIKRNSDSRIFTITLRNEFIPETLHELLIYNLLKEKAGGLWFSQDFGNITYFKENQGIIPVWQTYSLTSGLNPNVKNTYQFAETSDGNIWASLSQPQSHLNRFDRKNWTGFPISQIGGILNVVTSMLVAEDGAFWLGGWGILYIYQNKTWRLYIATEIPISDTRIIHLLETSDHTIWFINKGMNVMSFDYSTRYWTMLDQLNFHGETKDGKQWFLGADGRVICQDQNAWYSYGVEDGLMNAPVRLQISRTGEIWAAGSHGNIAATAYWDGQTWRMTQHPELSWGIDYRAVFEDWQGALWFGAAIDFEPEKGQLGGALRIKDHQITHLTSVLSSNFMAPYGIGQAKDNSIWFGGIYGLFRMDRSGIAKISEPTALTQQSIDVIYTSPQNDLWIGTRYFGIFRFDIIHSKWLSFNLNNGLSSNKIIDITITDEERIWTATNVGYDCYDGKRWTPGALPSIWHLSQDGGSLKTSTDGSIWINQTSKAWNRRAWPETPALKNYDFRTLRYKPDRTPPHTWLFETEKEIPQPGNAVFTWYGSDPWNNTAPTKIQYSWRLDNSEWSQFSTIDNHVFFKLPSGSHTFEVKSRDLDLNEDPTPALIHFTVLPPVWRQPWFISLITVLTGIICFQTIRIIRRDLKLHETNKYLARERSIEHLRAVFMSIRSIRDISESIRELGNEISRHRA